MKEKICADEGCTACNACINICPVNCISYDEDRDTAYSYAVCNKDRCIDCGLCHKTCPQIEGIRGNVSVKCFAAWSTDAAIRKSSASGGICTELYREFYTRNSWFAGVQMTNDANAVFYITNNIADIASFQNSKYVYSDTEMVYSNILEILKGDEELLFIGLPCQVAGLYKFLEAKRQSIEKLTTVDLVCHGVTPKRFWHEYLDAMQKKYSRKVVFVSFRDADFGTDKFILSLRDNSNNIFYKNGVKSNDSYQIGYHYGISYRENCYSCNYAKKERMGDLTVADFFGVGLLQNFNFEKGNLSCLLVNTPKGNKLVQQLSNKGVINVTERPLEEEYRFEKQLHQPTKKTKYRKDFIAEYTKNHDFVSSIDRVVKPIIVVNIIKRIIKYNEIRILISKLFSRNAKNKIRKIIKRIEFYKKKSS